MAQLCPTGDLENVDPATGLLSTLNSIGPAAGGKKGVAVVGSRPAFADLTSLYGGQVPVEDDQARMMAGQRQVPPVKEAPAPKLPLPLFPTAGNWQTAAPSTSTTGSLRLMR